MLLLRAKDHEHVEAFAQYAGIPVINGMTSIDHPCQVLADLFTVYERRENAFDLQWTWVGPLTSTAMGYAALSAVAGIKINFALPQANDSAAAKLERLIGQGAPIKLFTNAQEAVVGADVVITDQWPEGDYSEDVRSAFRVSSALLQKASDDYLFLHKLPASRGEEVTDEVLEGRHSVVYEQAGNRLCVQQAVMEWLFRNPAGLMTVAAKSQTMVVIDPGAGLSFLASAKDVFFKLISSQLGVTLELVDDRLFVTGPGTQVTKAKRVVERLLAAEESGESLEERDVMNFIQSLKIADQVDPAEAATTPILITYRGKAHRTQNLGPNAFG